MTSPADPPRIGLPSWWNADDPWLSDRMRRVGQIRTAEADIGQAVLRAMTAYLAEARRAVLGDPRRIEMTAAANPPAPALVLPELAADDPLMTELIRAMVAPYVPTPGEEPRVPLVMRAAADEPPPDLDAWPGAPLWLRLLRQFVMPVIGAVFALAFGEQAPPRPDDEPGDDRPAADEPPARGRILSDDRHYQRAYLDKVESRLVLWTDTAFERIRTELQAGLALGEDVRGLRDRVGRTLDIDAPSRALAAQIDTLTRTIGDPATQPQVAREARARRAALYRRKDRADREWWPSAARIARTEAVTALNGGTYTGAAAAAERDGTQRWVQWWSTTDNRVRPSHWAAHMQVREHGTPFDVGGVQMAHPGDPDAPADEVINCRCSVLILNRAEDVQRQRELYDRMLPGRTDIRGRPIDADGRPIVTDQEAGNAVSATATPPAPAAVVAATDDTVALPPPEQTHPVRRARWRFPLDRMGGGGGLIPMPTGNALDLRSRSLPAALLWQREAQHGPGPVGGAVDVGRVTTAEIVLDESAPWVMGEAEFDMGNPDARELVRRMDGGFLRWISPMIDTDPDAVAALAQRFSEDETAELPTDVDAALWRLGNITVLAQPEFDEATIELLTEDDAAEPSPEPDEDRDPDDVRAVVRADAGVVTTTTTGETDGMVALLPAEPAALAVDGGDPPEQLHMTLAYLGEVGDWSEDHTQAVQRIARRITGLATEDEDASDDEPVPHVAASKPFHLNVFSHAVFNPNGDNGKDAATVYLFDGTDDRAEVEHLAADVQAQLRGVLGAIGFPQQYQPWVPHVTAGYGLPVNALTYTGPVVFDRLRVALGDTVTDYPLGTGDAVVAAVTGDTGLPIADRHRAWDGGGARRRVTAWARDGDKLDPERMARAFLWRDPDADAGSAGAYRFGIADLIGGRLMIVPRAVFAAAAALQGARGGTTVPEADQARMRTRINGLYRRMREAWDDPSLTPPWETTTSSGTARRRPGEHRPGVMMSANLLPLVAASGSAVEDLRQSWAHRLATVANGLYEPPAGWFTDPKLSRPTPLTITAEGRVYGHAHDWTTKHVGYADRDVRALRDREGYRSFNLRPVRCADGSVVRAGALCKGGHAPTDPNTTAYAAQAHYDDPAKRLARVTAGRDEHGTWVAGALVPGVSARDLLDLAELSLSGDWREVDLGRGEGKFVGISVVNSPGLPIVVPDEHLGGYDEAAALVAAGVIVRDRPAWADQADELVVEDLAQRFGQRAGDAAWQRLLDHLTASGARVELTPPPTAPAAGQTAAAEPAPAPDVVATLAALAEVVNAPAPAAPVAASAAPVPVVPQQALAQLAELAAAVNAPAPAAPPVTASAAPRAELAALASVINTPALAALAGAINGK